MIDHARAGRRLQREAAQARLRAVCRHPGPYRDGTGFDGRAQVHCAVCQTYVCEGTVLELRQRVWGAWRSD